MASCELGSALTARGVTNQPLVIWVAHEFYERPEILALMAQGHRVVHVSKWDLGVAPDLILHPAAHYYDLSMADYLPAALTAARKRRKAQKEKK